MVVCEMAHDMITSSRRRNCAAIDPHPISHRDEGANDLDSLTQSGRDSVTASSSNSHVSIVPWRTMDCAAADDGIARETDWIRMFINEKCNKDFVNFRCAEFPRFWQWRSLRHPIFRLHLYTLRVFWFASAPSVSQMTSLGNEIF